MYIYIYIYIFHIYIYTYIKCPAGWFDNCFVGDVVKFVRLQYFNSINIGQHTQIKPKNAHLHILSQRKGSRGVYSKNTQWNIGYQVGVYMLNDVYKSLRWLLHKVFIPPLQRSWKGGILVSPCPSVRLWTESCPLYIFINTHRFHLIFAHLIKQF